MKYENFVQAENLVDQINKLAFTLRLLDKEIFVKITKANSDTIISIPISSDSEYEYAQPARQLIDTIKADLELRIQNLKSMLEQL
jgi:hypothetical protein